MRYLLVFLLVVGLVSCGDIIDQKIVEEQNASQSFSETEVSDKLKKWREAPDCEKFMKSFNVVNRDKWRRILRDAPKMNVLGNFYYISCNNGRVTEIQNWNCSKGKSQYERYRFLDNKLCGLEVRNSPENNDIYWGYHSTEWRNDFKSREKVGVTPVKDGKFESGFVLSVYKEWRNGILVEHYIRDKNQPLDFGNAKFGSYKFFYRTTGNIKEEIIYQNGTKIIQKRFYENGQIQGETIRGKSDRWWYENGQMQKEIIRDNNMSGKIIQTTQWDENGIRIN